MTHQAPQSNPFFSHRWETEVEHRVWIPPEAGKVASTKACLISGLRGSGKTALLNCLDPLAMTRDSARYLNPKDRPLNCIGVYISILAEFTEFLPLPGSSSWEEVEETPLQAWLHAHWFRTYVIFTCLARTLVVVDECQRSGVLLYSAQQESTFVDGFRAVWEQHFGHSPLERPVRSILECASALSKVCMATRVNSVRLYPDRVTSLLEQLEPVRFYREFCRLLAESRLLVGRHGLCHVKISLDDVHRFRRREQALLNGILEVNAAPVTWNFSFVTGGFDPSLSLDSAAPLTHHDVERVDLDYVSNGKGFRRICQKLFEVRVYGSTLAGSASGARSDYAKVLSNPNASVLFSQLVKDTVSQDFRSRVISQLDYVSGALEKKFASDRDVRLPERGSDKRRYLYHTYIFATLFNGDRAEFDRFLAERSSSVVDNYFRQKNVAALVCAANELGRQMPYAGKNVLISLSDGCIRDFLRILAIIYDNAASGVHNRRPDNAPDFFSPTEDRWIPIEDQTRSFVEASRTYIEATEDASDRPGRTLSSIVASVAELNRLLQFKDRKRALSLAERGAIRLNFQEGTLLGDTTERVILLREALAKGQHTGSIRLISGVFRSRGGVDETSEVVFRLHRLIAPQHNYSSRGPLRIVDVPINHFLEFAESTQISPRNWADRVFKSVQARPEAPDAELQQELF